MKAKKRGGKEQNVPTDQPKPKPEETLIKLLRKSFIRAYKNLNVKF